MITQQIKLYMDDTQLPDVRMVSGDVGREIMLTIYPNREEEEELDLTTFETRVIYIKPDNTFVIEDYLDGVMDIPEQAGAVVGRGYYQIRLKKNGEEIYSGQGNFIVDDYILNNNMIESIAEVNGMQFPDDFLTSADLSDYVTQEQLADYSTTAEMEAYVAEQIGELPSPLHEYSTTEKVVGVWTDGTDVYEKVIPFSGTVIYNGWTNTNIHIDNAIPITCFGYMADSAFPFMCSIINGGDIYVRVSGVESVSCTGFILTYRKAV